jgi:hypothetical protein
MLTKRTVFIGILCCTCPANLIGQTPIAPPPTVLFRVKPETIKGFGSDSGMGFLCSFDADQEPVLVSAYHVGAYSASRVDSLFTPEALDTLLTRVVVHSLADSSVTLEAGARIRIPDAMTMDSTCVMSQSCNDIAAFAWPWALTVEPLRLAMSPPEAGAPLWLSARLAYELGRKLGLQHAAVAGGVSSSGLLFYAFQDSIGPILLSHTSGAPIVNAGGEVVAVHVAVAHVKNVRPAIPDCCSNWEPDRRVGVGVGAATVRRLLSREGGDHD